VAWIGSLAALRQRSLRSAGRALALSGVAKQRAAHADFRRIDALNYTMLQDDGQRVEDPEGALAAKLG
jgi:regulator of PEP synthase PpsR (kinase-PPPase family)